MVGLIYLKMKRNWRAWLRMFILLIQQPYLLRKLQKREKEKDVIISFTAIESRLNSVNYTIMSILAGEVIPEGIYIYLDKNTLEIASNKSSLLKKFIKLGYVHLKKVEDVRSYKKLIFALEDHPQKYIIVCDDDMLYPKYWLSSLLKTYQKWQDPKLIVCHRAHKVSFKKDGSFFPYNLWSKEVTSEGEKSVLFFPTGTGGVLYPPNAMPEITKNADLFQEVAPTNDDIWFWFCAIHNKCSFALAEKEFNNKDFLETPNSQVVSLWGTNVGQNANDSQLKDTLSYFKEISTEFTSVNFTKK